MTTMTESEREFLQLVAKRAAADPVILDAVESGTLLEVLPHHAVRLMEETLTNQARLMDMLDGSRWSHEGPDELFKMTIAQPLYDAINA